ncbi:receptor-type tyrosine-protein phosphatase epsilon-like [Lineus longissimus]|uniref:receptor-type tyrosine-protein phosphatase epsilon-like n=1 Tax=Lineus longissimus TaxID=88925 RepID=UPI00315C7BED
MFSESDCKNTTIGAEYKGTQNTTLMGFTCADWLVYKGNYRPADSYNYCRNPDKDIRGPWCYITATHTSHYDFCFIPSCEDKLTNFKILIDENLCHHETGTVQFSRAQEIKCDTPGPVVGRRLKIQRIEPSSSLTLCEVSVQAFQYIACDNKRYGPNCNNQCQCANDDTCDDKTGQCPSGCNDRFTGPYCNIGVPAVTKDGLSTPTSISVRWQYILHDSAFDAGKFDRFVLRYTEHSSTSSTVHAVPFSSHENVKYNVTGLNPLTEYSFHLQLRYNISTKSEEVNGSVEHFRTESCAGYMGSPMITQSGSVVGGGAWPNRVSLRIHAQKPEMLADCFKDFHVYARKTTESSYMKLTRADQTYTLHNLTAFTEYDIKAAVTSPDGQEKHKLQKITTAEDVPSVPTIVKIGGNLTSVSIKITQPDQPYGVIQKYDLAMWERGSMNHTVSSQGPTNLTLTFNNLKLNTTYNFKARAFTSYGGGEWTEVMSVITEENSTSGTNVGLLAGLVIVMLIVLAAIIIPVVIILRKKRRSKEQAAESLETQQHEIACLSIIPEFECGVLQTENVSTLPIVPVDTGKGYSNLQGRTVTISDLAPYVKSIRGDRAVEFKDEFGELPVDVVRSTKEAKKPGNIPLNRYKNIITYDHSRVILQPIGEEQSDYINASYIHGYDKEKAYIASQGPLPKSITATWRMIWQERCDTIVMLTKTIEKEKKKCEQYWPSQGKNTYGPFTIQLVEEYKFTDYVNRILKVTLNGEVRIVKYFHFTAWPDHDVPKLACSLLNFRANVLKETEYGKVPILVHCSAGVGRTGAFIAIDYLIRQGKAEKKVNFYECALRMREQRPNMVQNLGQYTHIHDAILEYFKIGITSIKSDNFPQKYSDMIKAIPGKDACQLQNQYSILGAFTDAISPSEQALANMSKNRKQDIVPDGASRVVLSTPIDGWNDYVNAVYATGYGEKDNYIITQMPLPETMKDIWRIVHDTGISTIVMMNMVDDTYERKDDISGRVVRHFQLQNWPDGQATPASVEAIVDLLEKVEKWQQKVENKKILVQCLDGASQSGVFCAAHSVIEKVKVDQEVDVFQYLRLLRSHRPQLVNTYEQYKYVHEVVLRYLQNFDLYANFQ